MFNFTSLRNTSSFYFIEYYNPKKKGYASISGLSIICASAPGTSSNS